MELNIHLPTDEIAKQVNQAYGTVIFDGELVEMGLKVRITKREAIRVYCEGGKLHVKAPLEVYTKVIWKEKLLGVLDRMTPNVEDTDFEITAHFETTIKEDAHWRLRATTQTAFEWDRKPQWDLGVFKVRISSVIKPFINRKMEEVAEEINHFIEQEIQLEKHAKTAWEVANAPVLIANSPPIWLNINPGTENAFRRPIQFGAEEIATQISIPVSLTTTLGKAPEPAKSEALPAFQEKNDISKNFHTAITSHLPFRELSALFEGESFSLDQDKLRVEVRNLGMKLKGEILNTSISLQGTVKRLGRRFPFRVIMFVSTQPYLDSEAGRIKVILQDYEFLTRNWWLRLYRRLFNKAFKRELSREVNLFIASIDERVLSEIQQALQGQEIDELLRLHGRLDSFRHTGLQLTNAGIEVQSELQGEMDIKITLGEQSF